MVADHNSIIPYQYKSRILASPSLEVYCIQSQKRIPRFKQRFINFFTSANKKIRDSLWLRRQIFSHHETEFEIKGRALYIRTRPYTRLPQSRVGGQEQCWRRSLGHLGRSCMLKKLKNAKKVIVAKALDSQRYLCPAEQVVLEVEGGAGQRPQRGR